MTIRVEREKGTRSIVKPIIDCHFSLSLSLPLFSPKSGVCDVPHCQECGDLVGLLHANVEKVDGHAEKNDQGDGGVLNRQAAHPKVSKDK